MEKKDTRTIRERREQRKKLYEVLQQAGLAFESVEDVQEAFKDMVSMTLENGLEGELEEELGYSKYDYRNKATDNSRNGYTEKTLKSSLGNLEIAVPRDRKGEFAPQLVKKNQTTLSGDIEEKFLSVYAKGMSTSDIEAHIRDIYGLSVSDSTISRVTDKILPIVREWQQRPLENVYAVMFWTQSTSMSVAKDKLSRKRSTSRSGYNWTENAMYWACGLEKMKARSSGWASSTV